MYNLYVCALVSLLGLTLAGPFQEEPEFPYEYPDVEFPDENEEGTQQYYTPPENDARLMNSDDEQEKDEDAKIEVYYQNNWDGDLSVECSPGHGIFHFQSIHDNKREDRRWYFGCKQLGTKQHNYSLRCYWYWRINSYDVPMLFMCPANYYLAGVKSHHDNGREDRIWDAKCCQRSSYCTKNCRATGFVNYWDAPLHYTASSHSVFTGLFSYHDNKREDRVYKVLNCDFETC